MLYYVQVHYAEAEPLHKRSLSLACRGLTIDRFRYRRYRITLSIERKR